MGRLAMALALVLASAGGSLASAQPQTPAVRIDGDGAVHVPAMTVPQSNFLSPEAKAYVTQHLQDMQRPERLQQKDGVPVFMEGLRWRRKIGQAAKVGSTSLKDGLYDWEAEAVLG